MRTRLILVLSILCCALMAQATPTFYDNMMAKSAITQPADPFIRMFFFAGQDGNNGLYTDGAMTSALWSGVFGHVGYLSAYGLMQPTWQYSDWAQNGGHVGLDGAALAGRDTAGMIGSLPLSNDPNYTAQINALRAAYAHSRGLAMKYFFQDHESSYASGVLTANADYDCVGGGGNFRLRTDLGASMHYLSCPDNADFNTAASGLMSSFTINFGFFPQDLNSGGYVYLMGCRTNYAGWSNGWFVNYSNAGGNGGTNKVTFFTNGDGNGVNPGVDSLPLDFEHANRWLNVTITVANDPDPTKVQVTVSIAGIGSNSGVIPRPTTWNGSNYMGFRLYAPAAWQQSYNLRYPELDDVTLTSTRSGNVTVAQYNFESNNGQTPTIGAQVVSIADLSGRGHTLTPDVQSSVLTFAPTSGVFPSVADPMKQFLIDELLSIRAANGVTTPPRVITNWALSDSPGRFNVWKSLGFTHGNTDYYTYSNVASGMSDLSTFFKTEHTQWAWNEGSDWQALWWGRANDTVGMTTAQHKTAGTLAVLDGNRWFICWAGGTGSFALSSATSTVKANTNADVLYAMAQVASWFQSTSSSLSGSVFLDDDTRQNTLGVPESLVPFCRARQNATNNDLWFAGYVPEVSGSEVVNLTLPQQHGTATDLSTGTVYPVRDGTFSLTLTENAVPYYFHFFTNAGPTGSITSPPNNTLFTSGSNVFMQASAADSDGTVYKVEFKVDGAKVGEDTAAPYQYTWSSATSGSHALTAVVTDDDGATTTSSGVTISVVNETGDGLRGEYYENNDFTDLMLVRTDDNINFNWVQGSPDPTIGIDMFSIRWTGMIKPRYSETYTFTRTADDDLKVTINGTVVIDWGQASGTIALTANQKVSILVEYKETWGGASVSLSWSSASQANEIVPKSQLFSCGSGTGLRGDYYNNTDFTAPVALTRTEGPIDFTWGTSSPGSGVNADMFTVRWSGMIEPRYAGTYTFYTMADDKATLKVNGVTVINDTGTGYPPTECSGTISLNAWQKYSIEVDLTETWGGASIQLYWSSASQPKEIIPLKQLYVPGNEAPSIRITSPSDNAVSTLGTPITFTASAWDNDGTVTQVEFMDGNTVLYTDYTAPYSYTWTPAVVGWHDAKVRVTDNNGATTTTINGIRINNPPTVSITAPSAGDNFVAPASITVSANAADTDGTISQVEFFDGTTSLWVDNSSPYSVTWNSPSVGTHSITAKATDNDGVLVTSNAVSITVWGSTDIGTVGITGSASLSGTTYTETGAGSGVTGTADAFRFVYLPTTGDCTIIAKVASFGSTSPADNRAGVMMRQSLNANAIEASSLYYRYNTTYRVYFHRRTTAGQTTSTNNGTAAATPYWVKLVRSGNTLSSWRSANGASWTQVGSNTTVTMTGTIYVGLAVTSGTTASTKTATFDSVSITNP